MRAFADGVPNSKEITHDRNLVGVEAVAESFLHTMAGLADRLGPLLLQLLPSFDARPVLRDPARRALMAGPVLFSTGSLYPFGLDRVYGWISEAGYDGVEIMMDERWDTHQEDYLGDIAERHGLPILALHPPLRRGAWGLDPEETLVRVARLAGRMDVPVVVAHPPPPGRSLERWKAGTLREARQQGVVVAVENMPQGRRAGMFGVRRKSCYLPEHLADVGDVTLDTSHAGASKVDILRAHSVLATQLRHVHLSDSNLEAGRDEHRLPGKGRLSLKPFLAALGASGYTGAVSLELKPWPLGAPDPGTILERMRAALRFTREGLDAL